MAAHARRWSGERPEDVVDVRGAPWRPRLERGLPISSSASGWAISYEESMRGFCDLRADRARGRGAPYPSPRRLVLRARRTTATRSSRRRPHLAECGFRGRMMSARRRRAGVAAALRGETRDYPAPGPVAELTEDVSRRARLRGGLDLNTIMWTRPGADAPFAFDLPLARCSAFAGWSTRTGGRRRLRRRTSGRCTLQRAAYTHGACCVDPTSPRHRRPAGARRSPRRGA